MTDTEKAPTPVGLINFHGTTLLVVKHNGIEYIYAKPLSDLAGLDWRAAKRAILEDENVILYGITELKHPVLASGGGAIPTPKMGIYMRIDRAHMFLARINTSRMKAAGNVEGAEKLLKLQIEWAEVLHSYETTGIAVKKSSSEWRQREERNLATLFKIRAASSSPKEQAVLTSMIHDKLTDLGYPPSPEGTGAQMELLQ